MRVALLPTGRTEWHGLPRALESIFPGNDFYAVPSTAEMASYPGAVPYDGFTSVALGATHEVEPPESARMLIGRAAQEALGDRETAPADLVFVLDDLELVNAHQPEVVARVFERASRLHLGGLDQRAQEKTAQRLRERVSFHLIVPMIEAWFFGDPHALATAGVPPHAKPSLVSPELEAFETDDPGYLAATEAACPCWQKNGRRKKRRPKWLGTVDRGHHPKGYLQWLCLDGADENCTTYRETRAGGEALATLSWAPLLALPAGSLRYLRAFLADLAHGLGQQPTTGVVGELKPAVVTSLSARPANPVLRNL